MAILGRRVGVEMIRISVHVSSKTARFGVSIQAESIERALEIVARQHPGKECEVVFPIDPEAFFVEEAVGTVARLAA
jgi:thymidine kinase